MGVVPILSRKKFDCLCRGGLARRFVICVPVFGARGVVFPLDVEPDPTRCCTCVCTCAAARSFVCRRGVVLLLLASWAGGLHPRTPSLWAVIASCCVCSHPCTVGIDVCVLACPHGLWGELELSGCLVEVCDNDSAGIAASYDASVQPLLA